jgi:hypothetical protein
MHVDEAIARHERAPGEYSAALAELCGRVRDIDQGAEQAIHFRVQAGVCRRRGEQRQKEE